MLTRLQEVGTIVIFSILVWLCGFIMQIAARLSKSVMASVKTKGFLKYLVGLKGSVEVVYLLPAFVQLIALAYLVLGIVGTAMFGFSILRRLTILILGGGSLICSIWGTIGYLTRDLH